MYDSASSKSSCTSLEGNAEASSTKAGFQSPFLSLILPCSKRPWSAHSMRSSLRWLPCVSSSMRNTRCVRRIMSLRGPITACWPMPFSMPTLMGLYFLTASNTFWHVSSRVQRPYCMSSTCHVPKSSTMTIAIAELSLRLVLLPRSASKPAKSMAM